MSDLSTIMAKLAGMRLAVNSTLNENVSRNRGMGEIKTRSHFTPDQVQHYFNLTAGYINTLKNFLPSLFGDFQVINTNPETEMAPEGNPPVVEWNFSRYQLERLIRDIDQIFEIRANSELEQPKKESQRRIFISHGRSEDWRKVQPFIEKDLNYKTLELAQEPNAGRTIIEKLISNSDRCDSAVIVMTGDDITKEDESRVRENVMHEIGFFQGKYGRLLVILLHEDGVNIPSNLAGVVYIPFPKGTIEAGFPVLLRELKSIYKI